MKLRKVCMLAGVSFLLFLTSCVQNNAIVDTNEEIKGRTWSYTGKIKIPVKVEDATSGYSIYVNLRHTSQYKYSNIFLLIHQTGPDGKRVSERKEFKLANPDGQWLGSGSGNLYSYQLLWKESHRFPAKGTYTFELEQNMRDNPLKEVTDAGLRIVKAE